MADDGLERFEAALGAVAKITSDDTELIGARCPKCEASDFVRVSDLYAEAVGRLEADVGSSDVVRVGGMTDAQIFGKFTPPRRKSVVGIVAFVAIATSAVAYYLYRRFGDTVGQSAGIIAAIVVVFVLMTSFRRLSDRYYRDRQRWRSLFMCRRCGQLVAS